MLLKTSYYSPSSNPPRENPLTLPMSMSRETKETNHIGTMGRNYTENPRPGVGSPKNFCRRAADKKIPHPTVNKQLVKQENIKPNLESNTTYTKPIDNPPLAQGRTQFRLDRGCAKEPAGQSHKSTPYSSSVSGRTI